MEENNLNITPSKKNNNIGIIIILVLIIIGLTGFIVYNQFSKDNKTNSENNQSTESNNNNSKDNNGKILDTSKLLNNKNEYPECKKVYKEDLNFEGIYSVKIDDNDPYTALLTAKETYKLKFTKSIKQILLGGFGGDTFGDQIIFYLMEDGTIEYTPTWELKLDSTNNGFKSYGVISGVEKIKSLKNAEWKYSDCMTDGGGMTTIGIKEDESFYDLGIAYNNTINNANKPYNTIQDYVDECKNKGDNVKLINSIDEITINKTKITSEEEMKEYARLLVNSNLELGLGIANKNVKDATKNEILELILMSYVSSPDCVSQTVISQLADQLYDIKGFENKEYARYIDGYYCPGGLGGMTGEKIIKEEVTNDKDTYTYKFGIGSEDEVKKTIEVKFKKVNGLYKIIYFG